MPFTKDNPGSTLALLKYLSEITGKPLMRKVNYKSHEEAGYGAGVKYILNGEELPQLTKIYRKGGVLMLTDMPSKKMDIPIDTKFDEIYKMVYNPAETFGVELKKGGKYKECEGGGWYSVKQLYEVNGKYFIG